MTLYDDLDVAPDASQEDIRQAWRHAARRHHPDAGGDAAKFTAIAHAYEVLSDAESRRRYDRTGETGKPDSIETRAVSIVAGMFNALLDEIGDWPVTFDIVEAIREKIEGGVTKVRRMRAEQERAISRLERMGARIRGPVFEAALRTRIDEARRSVASADAEIAAAARAIEILKDHHHDPDPAPATSPWNPGPDTSDWRFVRFTINGAPA